MPDFQIELQFPCRQHSDMKRIEHSAQEWALRFGLSEHARQFGTYAAMTCPSAPVEGAELMADVLTWLFVIDDHYECAAGLAADAPLIAALTDISMRLGNLSSSQWRDRFHTHFAAMLAAATKEIELRDDGSPPPFGDYVTLRRNSGAMLVVFDVLEVCFGAELLPEVYQSSVYQEIVLAGADIVTWTNDLHSYEKEMAGGLMTNMVLVLRHHSELDLADAVDATVRLIHDRAAALQAAAGELTEDGPAFRCATAVCEWVAGSNRWHTDGTDRYRHTG
ncbi:terpene synthase family protein [Lentzea alba]|uniref:terpene synthase family protein n=1 Tax=Lentzea alba TaxID=2714351 RepID=UPI0039BF4963